MRLLHWILLCSMAYFPHAKAAETPFDPFYWMEEVEGEKALDWVNKQTQVTKETLEKDPAYKTITEQALAILMAKDKVSFASYRKGFMYDFWKDDKNPRGLIRRATIEEYKKAEPKWETVLDIDELAAKEKENWVFDGTLSLGPNTSRRLMKLSRGGKDAVEIREFDYETKQFIKDGFFIPEAKSQVAALDENTLLIATDYGPDSMTDSGYPRIIKLWKRGEPLSAAKTVYECDKSDVLAFAGAYGKAPQQYMTIGRYLAGVDSINMSLYEKDGSLTPLSIPERAEAVAIHDDFIYLKLKIEHALSNRNLPANSIVRFPLRDKNLERAEIVFAALPSQSIDGGIDLRDNYALIEIMDNIKSRVLRLDRQDSGEWKQTVLPFPATGVLSLDVPDSDDIGGITTLTYTDFLTPTTQSLVNMDDGYRLEPLKSARARFDASQMVVNQYFATSADGTKVPYFIVHKKDLVYDGSTPTLLTGYGGFEISQTPYYSGLNGKIWMEPGGVYVVANIRGGGEFGPSWHLQAIKENRQKSFDDFAAVAEDLIARQITSPRHLGILGGSNGGLLVGTVMVQRPELFNAVSIQVPLLDMLRYHKLLAGASWVSEYGNPDIPEECAYILKYSPYQNVKPGVKYPIPLFETSRADDRVHPAHARKMAIRMKEQGHPVLFLEKADGGHGGGATLKTQAEEISHSFTYLWNRLR